MAESNRGQALIESLISLPTLMALFSALLIGGHSLLTDFLMDQWIYESTFCLIEEKPRKVCIENLKNQIKKIPLLKIETLDLFKRSNQAQAQVRIKLPYLKEIWSFDQKLSFELNHKDFEGKF